MDRDQKFLCVSDLGEIFEITTRRMHNVFRLNLQGRRVEEWCVTPFGNFPVYDIMLAQKLALETDSASLRERANVRDLVTGRLLYQSPLPFTFEREADYLALN